MPMVFSFYYTSLHYPVWRCATKCAPVNSNIGFILDDTYKQPNDDLDAPAFSTYSPAGLNIGNSATKPAITNLDLISTYYANTNVMMKVHIVKVYAEVYSLTGNTCSSSYYSSCLNQLSRYSIVQSYFGFLNAYDDYYNCIRNSVAFCTPKYQLNIQKYASGDVTRRKSILPKVACGSGTLIEQFQWSASKVGVSSIDSAKCDAYDHYQDGGWRLY